MTNIPPNAYSELKAFIDDTSSREHECREYLKYVPQVLFKENAIEYLDTETEYRHHTGDSDYIIIGKIRTDITETEKNRVYVWELKAPQCKIFKRGNNNRLCPTKELVDAENQLLHYCHELKKDGVFKDEYGVSDDNILFGGIIIGSKQTLISGNYTDVKKIKLFNRALTVRNLYFYSRENITLKTWDNILDQIRPPQVVSTRNIIEEPVSMPMTVTLPNSASNFIGRSDK